ncbi:Imm8 family immunity protein [Pseudomonadota bacterium]
MKNKLILNSLSSSDVDLEDWNPMSNDDVFICLDMEIGHSDIEQGINLFYVTLATPESLRKHRAGSYLVKNRTLVISEYSYVAVHSLILEILDACSRDTWNESCNVLQRYFQWEYEDYVAE